MPSSLIAAYGEIAHIKVGTFVAFSFGLAFFFMIMYSILSTVYKTKNLKSFG
jgi:hypothetical protein